MNRSLISYSVILVVSLFFFAVSFSMPVTEVTVVSSALFPRIVLGTIILLCASGAYKARKLEKASQGKKINSAFYISSFAILGLILAMQYIGFIFAAGTFISIFSLYMLGEMKPKSVIISFAAGFSIALGIHYIFTNILTFILP